MNPSDIQALIEQIKAQNEIIQRIQSESAAQDTA